jgi:hypothetical protein
MKKHVGALVHLHQLPLVWCALHRAQTAGDLVAALREFRGWAGSPPFRKMASHARYNLARTTMWNALNSNELPKLDVVMAIIQGCGGSQEDLRIFSTAHRRINLGKLGTQEAAQ